MQVIMLIITLPAASLESTTVNKIMFLRTKMYSKFANSVHNKVLLQLVKVDVNSCTVL